MNLEDFLKVKVYFEAAVLHMRHKKFGKALEIYRSILSLDSENYTALFGIAMCLIENKSRKHAMVTELGRKLTSLYPDSYGSWVVLGQGLFGLKEYLHALSCYAKSTQLLEALPDDETKAIRARDLKLKSVYCLMNQSDPEQQRLALGFLSSILRRNETDAEALLAYGHLMMRRREYSEALSVALKMLATTSSSGDRRVKQLLCEVMQQDGMIAALLKILTSTTETVFCGRVRISGQLLQGILCPGRGRYSVSQEHFAGPERSFLSSQPHSCV